MKLLLDYDYPGNIRELENIIERAIIICDKKYIEIEHLPEEVKNFAKNEVFKENSYLNYNEEAERIKEVLRQTKGNKSLAAKILGMHRTTLWRKIKEYNIEL
jgi:transcriptional regulator with PAS, ATPase and Fis domain